MRKLSFNKQLPYAFLMQDDKCGIPFFSGQEAIPMTLLTISNSIDIMVICKYIEKRLYHTKFLSPYFLLQRRLF